MDIERRHLGVTTAELRIEGDNAPKLIGYASVFNVWYEVRERGGGRFMERIAPAAFEEVLRGEPDVVALFNHDPDHLLGRNGRTLTLTEDATGLKYDIALADTTVARDVRENVRAGNITGSSFSFAPTDDGEVWEQRDGVAHRTVTRMALLQDVGPVTFPASKSTVVAARSMDMAAAYDVLRGGAPLSVYQERQRLVERI